MECIYSIELSIRWHKEDIYMIQGEKSSYKSRQRNLLLSSMLACSCMVMGSAIPPCRNEMAKHLTSLMKLTRRMRDNDNLSNDIKINSPKPSHIPASDNEQQWNHC